ncbi:aspartate ammonia-lyase [Liquorilactobacillus mali]|uniref:Aspartate ammonia-lyase n=1 Tax=Liquorilactobacillus mali TaxID=1618 RepID=A0A0R2FQ97_9LACO|nr:aspartate ammonia-lyase [Liquorilactobacillus mali]KRN29798.1 aspartate ammonia-lyase [Liquorilactobacillus mali]MDN7145533.1 aspartate ammonia-lyase [Liquorilactobacillus mali]
MRVERDCVGELEIEEDALFGINAARAVRNFPISNEPVNPLLIISLIEVKKAAAMANHISGALDGTKAKAIIAACDTLLEEDYRQNAFIVPAFQGGAGTSVNMNVNEVIANLANKQSNSQKIHPNDDVNLAQSTNDTFPTAGKVALLKLLPKVQSKVLDLIEALDKKATEFNDVVKLGRTQLQDAVPTTFGNSFRAYASLFKRDYKRLEHVKDDLSFVNLGGTAIGTGLNADDIYQKNIVGKLSSITRIPLKPADNLIDATQNCDVFVEFSGVLKTLAVNLSKFSNDLRLLSSGPQAGLAELRLPARQAGSSIMPGKINPVIPEVVNQVAFQVVGNDAAITMAAEGGQLELNAFEPLIFRNLLQNESYLENTITTLIENCVAGIEVNQDVCKNEVENSVILATALTPVLGYQVTTKIVKRALREHSSIREIILSENLMEEADFDNLMGSSNLLHQAKSKNYSFVK